MKYSEYQELAMRTASPVSRATDDNLLMQAAMGLCGEIGEFIKANDEFRMVMFVPAARENAREHALKELGDIMWYAITGMKALGITGEELDGTYLPSLMTEPDAAWMTFQSQTVTSYMAVNAGAIIDMVKKQTFHGEGHDVDKEAAAGAISRIVLRVKFLSYKLGSSLEEVMEKNIQKLRERYPEGFDADLSAHRKEGDV